MAKKLRFDEGGDSDELQALFDSIATSPAKPEPKVVVAPASAPAAQKDASGDDDELQALVDGIAAMPQVASRCARRFGIAPDVPAPVT